MVADLEKRVRHGKIEDQMKAYLSAMDACGDNEYGTDDLTGKLGCLVSDVLRNKDFSVPILERVVAECEKVVASLDETLSLFVAVKQDLLETGSTSLKRLNRLWENKWLAQTHSDLLDVNTQEDVDSLRQALTRITLCYYGPLGHAQELMRNLKLEIHEASWD
ncbi:hypothetical protein MYCTH_2300650 [Thermothelomyces thermophilus ATCC 42464]|uniref:Uncharacterized protein n=1 Tax=Thermothelomyces thermophilus (strain ATCC 42464 / BCRC 31852 / DSM 1799) TaxID=573729 RepID=G2Q7V3_THET4|nr:uncharacterized protein MYCTH_2300650 [Thermothelomyces thermophilus ATCC 42464]AEO56110.1 hypothetical protein MYCTH_2300650 [Thermothelomyces thermophilus ATCC 42464]